MSTLRTSNLIHGSSAVSNVVLDTQGRASFGPDGPNGRAALYVDPQNNRVGVNNESPSTTLDVDGAINTTGNLTVGGTLNLTGAFTSDVINAGSGTAAAPSVSVGTTDNGLYSPGTDQVAISTNGTERMQIDSSGRLLVGTTTAILDTSNALVQTSATQGSNFVLHRDATTVNSSDSIGLIRFYSNAGSSKQEHGRITCIADGTSGANDKPGALLFYTTADGASTPTERLRIDSSGRLLVGTSSELDTGAEAIVHVVDTLGARLVLARNDSSVSEGNGLGGIRFAGNDTTGNNYTTLGEIICQADGTHAAGDNPTRLVFSTTADGASSPTERLRIDSSGNVGIGTSSPINSANFNTLSIGNGTSTGGQLALKSSGNQDFYLWHDANGVNIYNQSATSQIFYTGAAERMRIDSSGNVGIGEDNPEAPLHVGSADSWIDIGQQSGNRSKIGFNNNIFYYGNSSSVGQYVWKASTTRSGNPWDSGTERMRIDSSGNVLMGKTSTSISSGGFEYRNTSNDQQIIVTTTRASGGEALLLNRQAGDGVLASFYQGSTAEGSISVSGTTVSYNGGHLSRWSQLAGSAERTEILRGSVLSNLDEMCEWDEEDNEQLNRMQVSDVEGDKNVAGVFMAWDDDEIYPNDFYCSMTGDFVIRIAQGTTVARGDLLMSAGDGTAKPQDDDIIRSKTIAKVTSTNVSETYADGSYCVPCVLMAC
jgi:hypothetical protein